MLHKLLVFSACAVGVVRAQDIFCDNNCQPATETEGKYFCLKSDATKYTQCAHGQRYVQSCAPGTVWNSAANNCDWPSSNPTCDCGGATAAPATTTTTTKKPATTTTKTPSATTTTTKTTLSTILSSTTTKSTTTMAGTTTTTKGTTTTTTKTPAPTTTQSSTPSDKSIICYFTNWAQYRQGIGKFLPSDIDPNLCTHIIYAFFEFSTTAISYREWNDNDLIKAVMDLKDKNPNLKVIASIGGWNAGTSTFSQIIASSSSQSTFNKAAIKFVRDNGFDGLDVDFEYPADRGSPATDKARYAAWMDSLAADFVAEAQQSGKDRLLLTAAIGAGKATIDKAYDLPKIGKSIDMIFVMTYDFHGTWEPVTGFNSPLKRKPSWPVGSELASMTVEASIKYLKDGGIPAGKLMLGIPLYGHSFRLTSASNNGIGAPASGAGTQGTYTGEAGFNSYYETCMLTKCTRTPYTVVEDDDVKAPYMYSGNNWISTENQNSVKAKAEFAISEGLGGVMYWAIDLDDFKDACQNGVKYPLMKTVASVILRNQPLPVLNTKNIGTDTCGALVV